MKRAKRCINIIVPVSLLICVFLYSMPINSQNIHREAKKTIKYEITPGETLWSIGNKFCGNDHDVREWICEIESINDIQDCGALRVGQKIKVEDWSNQ